MKSMLDTLDLTGTAHGFDFEPTWAGGYMKHAQEWPQFYNAEYADNLRTALVAALGVIDAYKATDSYPGVTAESIVAVKACKAELETALEPFKVAGGDAKETLK